MLKINLCEVTQATAVSFCQREVGSERSFTGDPSDVSHQWCIEAVNKQGSRISRIDLYAQSLRHVHTCVGLTATKYDHEWLAWGGPLSQFEEAALRNPRDR